jgi:hypothetical protein
LRIRNSNPFTLPNSIRPIIHFRVLETDT